MRIDNHTIIFKSNPLYYNKEKHGIKPNTVRKVNANELGEIINNLFFIQFIRIENTETEEFFIRKLKDISFILPEIEFIFSWEHNEC